MAIMKKTECGTLYAKLWDFTKGFGFGVYNSGPTVGSFECIDGTVKLFLNDDAIERLGIEIVHVNDGWDIG